MSLSGDSVGDAATARTPDAPTVRQGRVRLAVYIELPYRRDEEGYSCDRAFIRFVLALTRHVESLVLIGRVDPVPGRSPYAIPADVEVASLPHYPTLKDIGGLVVAAPAALRTLVHTIGRVDAVWSIGPHPMSIPAAVVGVLRGRRVVLGVRQDFPQYVRHRLPSRRWQVAVWAAHVLDAVFRLLARRLPTVAVGAAIARRYGHGRAAVLELVVSLVSENDFGDTARDIFLPPARPVEFLSVGRLDSEKAPDVLLTAFATAARRSRRTLRLTFVGTGPLEPDLRSAAAPVAPYVRFLGYVPQGPALNELYRRADIFLHSARTEGVPQVLVEAFAAGLPTVATDVGGVRAATADGRAALLVSPEEPDAYADAMLRLVDDEALRRRLSDAARAAVSGLTLESQATRAAKFILGE